MSANVLNLSTNILFTRNTFICGICKNLLQTPIILTESCGNVCKSCFDATSIDTDNGKAIPNMMLDEVLNELKIPCKYVNVGCQEEIAYKKLIDHENNCNFMQRPCFIPECHWSGGQSNFAQHFEDKHKDLVVEGPVHYTISEEAKSFDMVKMLKRMNAQNYVFLRLKYNENECILFYKLYCDTQFECSLKLQWRDDRSLKINVQSAELGRLWGEEELSRITLDRLGDSKDHPLRIDVKNVKTSVPKLDEQLLHFFECPVCQGLMKPPIHQCTYGHSICNECRSQIERCPMCRNPFSNIRNFSLEGLTASLRYPCAYRELGCMTLLCNTDVSRHEHNCPFKPFTCPITDCKFAGRYKPISIAEHLQTAHSNLATLSSPYRNLIDFRIEPDYFNHFRIDRSFLINDATVYRLSIKRSLEYTFWAVEILSNHDDENLTHVYEIGIIDMRKVNRKLIRTDECLKEMPQEELFKKSILFPNNILSSYSRNDLLSFYCIIHKYPRDANP